MVVIALISSILTVQWGLLTQVQGLKGESDLIIINPNGHPVSFLPLDALP